MFLNCGYVFQLMCIPEIDWYVKSFFFFQIKCAIIFQLLILILSVWAVTSKKVEHYPFHCMIPFPLKTICFNSYRCGCLHLEFLILVSSISFYSLITTVELCGYISSDFVSRPSLFFNYFSKWLKLSFKKNQIFCSHLWGKKIFPQDFNSF